MNKPPQSKKRTEARRQILEAANRHQARLGLRFAPYVGRHLDRAVCVARRNRLVPKGVLVAAGYNANEAR